MPDQNVPITIVNDPPDNLDLVEHGKDVARSSFSQLTGPDDDILPMLIWKGPYGLGMMPLLEMSDDAAKDNLATQMTTMLAISRATEAVQVTTNYMVKVPVVEGKAELGLMPSEHPDRIEGVGVMYMSQDNGDRMVHAEVSRSSAAPTLGDWEDGEELSGRMEGRFGNAVHLGLSLGKNMPPHIAEIVDEAWKKDEVTHLAETFHTVFEAYSKFTSALANATGDE